MRRLTWSTWCVLLLAVRPALGAQLTVGRHASELQVVVSGTAFPPTLPQDLKSGLTNNILIRLELLQGSSVQAQSDISISIRYDLWDENFPAIEMVGSSVFRKEDFDSLDKAMAFLARIPLPDVFGIAKLPSDRTYRIRARLLLNPIDKERLDNLRKWVAENAGTVGSVEAAAPATLGPGVAAPAGAPLPNSLFNRIFRGYSGVGTSAAWGDTVESAPFTAKELAHDGE